MKGQMFITGNKRSDVSWSWGEGMTEQVTEILSKKGGFILWFEAIDLGQKKGGGRGE